MTDRPHLLRRVGAGMAAVAAVLTLATAVASPASAARDDDLLTTGEQLLADDRLVSPSGRYALELVGTDLRLTERPGRFTPGTSDVLAADVGRLLLQDDGNLVIFTTGGAVLDSFRTEGLGTTAVRLQDDRNLVFFNRNGSITADAGLNRSLFLLGGQVLLPGDQVPGEDGSLLVMQADGTLGLLDPRGTPVWDSGTGGNPGAAAVVQADGNLVVYAADASRGLWSTGSRLGAPPELALAALRIEDEEISLLRLQDGQVPFSVWSGRSQGAQQDREPGPGRSLLTGDELDPGEFRTNGAGCWVVMQADGNLVQYCGGPPSSPVPVGVPVFATGVPRAGGPGEGLVSGEARMQEDGNLVVYRVTQGRGITGATFQTGTRGDFLTTVLQDDANLVVYGASVPSWSRLTGPL